MPKKKPIVRKPELNRDMPSSNKLSKSLVLVLFQGLDKGLVGGQCPQRTAHMGINNLQTVDIAGIDPSEPVFIPG